MSAAATPEEVLARARRVIVQLRRSDATREAIIDGRRAPKIASLSAARAAKRERERAQLEEEPTPDELARRGDLEGVDIAKLRRLYPIREDLPWELDDAARLFVWDHPGGATLAEVGALFGVSRERIRQIEEGALEKLARRGPRLRLIGREDLDP